MLKLKIRRKYALWLKIAVCAHVNLKLQTTGRTQTATGAGESDNIFFGMTRLWALLRPSGNCGRAKPRLAAPGVENVNSSRQNRYRKVSFSTPQSSRNREFFVTVVINIFIEGNYFAFQCLV